MLLISLLNTLRRNAIKSIAAESINTSAKTIIALLFALFLVFANQPAFAKDNITEVAVKDAWIRTTVPGQTGTGAFMSITAKSDLRLVSASSPVAGIVEVHEMKMNGDVMQMRAVARLDLPAGKAVALSPGGLHIMLLDLKAALPKDVTVPLTLVFKDAKGVQHKVKLEIPVATAAPGGKAGMNMGLKEQGQSQHKH